MTVPFLACMAGVAAFYHLPPRVLPAIQAVEGGRAGVVHRNRDGSQDLGVMQVNTRWIEPIARATGLPVDAVQRRLTDDACFNIAVAGAIMRVYLDEARGDLMLAVGYYHSHTPWRNHSYRTRVLDAASALFGRIGP